jgi:hypothetical protein
MLKYTGDLYARYGRKHIPTGKTGADWDDMDTDMKIMRQALKFYADPQSYGLGGGSIQRVIVDSGAIARGALRLAKNKTE